MGEKGLQLRGPAFFDVAVGRSRDGGRVGETRGPEFGVEAEVSGGIEVWSVFFGNSAPQH